MVFCLFCTSAQPIFSRNNLNSCITTLHQLCAWWLSYANTNRISFENHPVSLFTFLLQGMPLILFMCQYFLSTTFITHKHVFSLRQTMLRIDKIRDQSSMTNNTVIYFNHTQKSVHSSLFHSNQLEYQIEIKTNIFAYYSSIYHFPIYSILISYDFKCV